MGAEEDNAEDLQGNATGADLSPGVDNFINTVLGLSVNAVIVSFFNPASALIGLQEVSLYLMLVCLKKSLPCLVLLVRVLRWHLPNDEEEEGLYTQCYT